MNKANLVLAGTACLALQPAFALGQQDSKAPTDDTKATTTRNDMTAKTDRNCDHDYDYRAKPQKKQKKDSPSKAPAKEPTENEKIFDEMLRSAASSGL